MIHIFQTASSRYLLCYMLFAILFTLMACPQLADARPAQDSLSLASFRQAGETKCLQPPPNLNLQVSTDQQLVSWGLPTHQAIAKDPALIKSIASLKHRVCGSAPADHPFMQQWLKDTGESGWGGYVAKGNRNTYAEANAYFTVPKLQAGPSGLTYTDGSVWVGVGGVKVIGVTPPPIELVQAGVDFQVDANGNQNDYAWWEVYGTVTAPVDNNGKLTTDQLLELAVGPGDPIWAYVSSNADNDGYDGFLLENQKSGTYATHYEYTSSLFTDGYTAECIVEDHISQGTYLANFGDLSIKGCGVYTNYQIQNTMYSIGTFNPSPLTLSYSGTPLATTSGLTNGSDFDVTFKNSGYIPKSPTPT